MTQNAKLFGYARVSSTDQDLTIQIDALMKAGVNEALIFSEKMSGSTREGSVELARCLALLSPADTLVVMRLDRLARSMKDYSEIIEELRQKGVGLKCTHEPIDASGPMGMLVMDILMAVASFETRRRRERQMEGVAKAKLAGKYKGRKRKTGAVEVKALRDQGMGASAIARALGCSRRTVYRAIEA